MMKKRLYPALPALLIDDEKPWLRSLSLLLKAGAGINHTLWCDDSREAMGILARQPVSLILLDLTMPHIGGEELLCLIAERHPEIPVIVLTGMNQVETAVASMRAGACDFFVKTTEEERLVAGVRRALARRELESDYRKLKERLLGESLENPEVFAGILTDDRKMEAILRYVEAVAPSGEPVLIEGESGVGKELIARAVHRLGRPEGPWVAVNAAGLDDHLFADTLFGHTRGAFTDAGRERAGLLAQADGGTLFLDEIGDLSPASQVKLLRLLQEGEYYPIGADEAKRSNARLVFATNLNLAERQEEGAFRRDLYYRLCTHRVHIPPLRERPEDLPILIEHFLGEAASDLGRKKPTAPRELCTLLSTYQFPGNIRELRAMVYDAVSTHRSKMLSMKFFKEATGRLREVSPSASPKACGERLPTLRESAGLLVAEAMRRAEGNQSVAAGLLGISQQALSKRLKKAAQ